MFNYLLLFFSLFFIACNYRQGNEQPPIEIAPSKLSIDSSSDIWHKNIDYTLADSFKISKLRIYSTSWNRSCFPMPMGKLLLRNYKGEAGYDYLISNFDSLTSKVSTEKERSAGMPCSWKQNFKAGLSYSVNSCKAGTIFYEIHTTCNDKKALIQLVDVLFSQSLNNWDADSSNYIPILEEHGNYFTIEKNDKGNYDLKYTKDE